MVGSIIYTTDCIRTISYFTSDNVECIPVSISEFYVSSSDVYQKVDLWLFERKSCDRGKLLFLPRDTINGLQLSVLRLQFGKVVVFTVKYGATDYEGCWSLEDALQASEIAMLDLLGMNI